MEYYFSMSQKRVFTDFYANLTSACLELINFELGVQYPWNRFVSNPDEFSIEINNIKSRIGPKIRDIKNHRSVRALSNALNLIAHQTEDRESFILIVLRIIGIFKENPHLSFDENYFEDYYNSGLAILGSGLIPYETIKKINHEAESRFKNLSNREILIQILAAMDNLENLSDETLANLYGLRIGDNK